MKITGIKTSPAMSTKRKQKERLKEKAQDKLNFQRSFQL